MFSNDARNVWRCETIERLTSGNALTNARAGHVHGIHVNMHACRSCDI
jgi:hypothetical protein